MNYNYILGLLKHKVSLYTGRHNIEPNIIVMSKDVWTFLKDHTNNNTTVTLTEESKKEILGINIAIIKNNLTEFCKVGHIDLD